MPRSPQGKFISFKTCICISSSQSQRYLNDSAFLLEYLHGLVWNCGFKKKKREKDRERKRKFLPTVDMFSNILNRKK